MSKFVTLFIAGGVSGALYSLIAAGLVVTYSATGIFNLGYGAVTFTCALLYYELHVGLGWPVVWAAVVTIGVFAPLLGVGLHRAIFQRLTHANESAKVMATVGVLIALPALAKCLVDTLVSTGTANIPTGDQVLLAPGVGPSPPHVFHLGDGLSLNSDQIIILGVAAVCAVLLWALMHKTALGLHMRAVVDRPELAQYRGIDRRRTSESALIIGTMLAGLAGVVGSPIFNNLDPDTYVLVTFAAIAAAVVGGLRSVPWAFAGGLLLGIVQNLVGGYVNFANIQGLDESVPFVVLLVGLFFLGRDRVRRTGSASDEPPPWDFGATSTWWRQALPMVCGLGLILVYVEWIGNSYWVLLITTALALSVVFLSYTVVTGLGGIVSLAQAAFVTGSGLMTGLLMDRVGAPWLVALLGAVSFSVLLGVVVAVPALRLGGLSLALSSLALGFIGDQVLFVWPTLENGQSGWIVKVPFGLSDPKRMAIVLVVVIGLVVLGLRSLRKSQTGRAIVAIRTSEAAAESSGLSLPATKLWLFGLSAGIAGLGGFLIASTQGSANDSTYTTTIGLVWIASVVLWGVRRSGAAIIAAMTAMILPGLLISGIHWWPWVPSWLSWRGTKNPWVPEILFGLGAIQMARSPDGLLAVLGVAGRAKPALEEIPASGPISAEPMQSAPRAVFLDPSVEQRDAAVVIELVNVSAGYEEVKVLRGVDLVLRRGTITALVGANGAGKSTLAKVIAGSVLPSEGAIWYSGKELHGRSTFLRARDGILLSPEGRGIFPGLSVDENLAIRLRQSSERSRVYDRFPILGERRQIAAGALSGGEQQLLALASIVAKPPTVVIADEPTLGLAPLVVTEILRVIQELRDEGVAILLIEEKARSVLDLADDVAFLERGQIIWQGPQGQVDEQQMTSIFLGRAGGELLGELREVPR